MAQDADVQSHTCYGAEGIRDDMTLYYCYVKALGPPNLPAEQVSLALLATSGTTSLFRILTDPSHFSYHSKHVGQP